MCLVKYPPTILKDDTRKYDKKMKKEACPDQLQYGISIRKKLDDRIHERQHQHSQHHQNDAKQYSIGGGSRQSATTSLYSQVVIEFLWNDLNLGRLIRG